MISIRNLIHQYAASLEKTWHHDRNKTVGASEVGQCVRRTWFSKNNAPRDQDYAESWGARERGNRIEAFVVEAIRATLPDTMRLIYAGDEQRTLTKGYLSATTDGLIISSDPEFCINLDIKSIDPRINLTEVKTENRFQTQAQMGLIRECTNYRPDVSIIPYVNASFYDDVKEFMVTFDERAYAAAHARAEIIMTERDPLRLQPEGKMAGGKECAHCPWSSHCAEAQVAGVPTRYQNVLSGDDADRLEELCSLAKTYAGDKSNAEERYADVIEEIKQFLRDHDTRRYFGDGWSVSYSAVNGKATLDTKAVEAAGINLEPFYKQGKPSDRLVVK